MPPFPDSDSPVGTTLRGTILLGLVNPRERADLAREFNRRGWRVVEVANGLDVCSVIERNHPQISLLDAYLPGQNAFEILERLLDDPNVPPPTIAVLIDSPDADPRLEALGLGAVGWVDKTADVARIADDLERIEDRIQAKAIEPRIPHNPRFDDRRASAT
jgi:DNA-binding response OmpR family regulator